jgi:hypothetical protein
MNPPTSLAEHLGRLPRLLGGDPAAARQWMAAGPRVWLLTSLLWIGFGAGLYGAALGTWRAPMQAVFNGIKFPLILLLTAVGNSFFNALLAPLLGIQIGWRESLASVLLSFNLLSAILAAFSPLTLFLVWNLPGPDSGWNATQDAYATILVSQSVLIAFAGIVANLHLLCVLTSLAGSPAPARRLLIAWLAANLVMGTQLSWIARPFFGRPNQAVQFLRDDAIRGNFFEAFFVSTSRLFRSDDKTTPHSP